MSRRHFLIASTALTTGARAALAQEPDAQPSIEAWDEYLAYKRRIQNKAGNGQLLRDIRIQSGSWRIRAVRGRYGSVASAFGGIPFL